MSDHPPSVTDTRVAPHFAWGTGCDGWHLLQFPALSIVEERMPPGASEVRHYHRQALQFFYVLSGHLAIEIDRREFQVAAGQGISIPAGAAHEVRNRSTADATFLVISCPPSQGDRVPAPFE